MEHDVFVGKVFGTDEFNVLLKAFCTQRQMTEARSVFVKMVPRVLCRAQQPQVVYLSISASSPDKTIFQIENSGVIACLRANSAEVAYEAANAAIADGISLNSFVLILVFLGSKPAGQGAPDYVTRNSIEEYISRGASAVVLSDAIFEKETIAKRNYEKIQKLAHFAALLGNKV
ncbi:hypothetical protein AHAS_Ahas12G0084200 [Arachis hypogaea]